MKKSILLSLALVAATGTKAAGVDTLAIDAIYQQLLARPGVVQTAVRYTGSWSQDLTGFAWSQGQGRGWTVGNRLRLTGVKQTEFDRYWQVFEQYKKQTHVSMDEGRADMGLNDSRLFYGIRLQGDTLYFLKARKEADEFTVPKDWAKRDYYKGPTPRPDYWAAVDAPTKRLLGLSHLWNAVKCNFVFMDRAQVDWDSLYVAMIPQMKAVKTDAEAVRLLQRMVARLGDGHTYVYGYNSRKYRTMPLTTRWVDGKVYVDQVYSSSFAKQGVRRGQEVVSINGEAPESYAQRELAPYISTSTPQWLIHEMYDGQGLTRVEGQRPMTLQLRDGKRQMSVSYDFDGSGFDLIPEPSQPVSFRLLDDGIGYLRIENFMDSHLCDQFDRLYPQILQTRALIIDVRDNPGGNSGNGDYIAYHFVADSVRTGAWESREYIPAFASWGYKERTYREEGNLVRADATDSLERYTRPVALLVGRGTFSAAEDFTGYMRATGYCTLVGEPTGGSTGNALRVEVIPGVCGAKICSKHDYAPDGSEFVGRGFTPDILAPETYKTYFKDKCDNAMTKALACLRKQLQGWQWVK